LWAALLRQNQPETGHQNDAVTDVGRLIAARAPKHVSVEVSLHAPGAAVKCIPEEMHQVIRNLWQNALDAVGDTGKVTVRTRIDGRFLVLDVSDNGKGIPEDQLQRIFTPFFTTKDPGQGMGLGLAITHQVVDMAGGTIRVQSAVGQGTTFVVHLPLSQPDPVAITA
jgi:signal transduction histidine kinase